MIPQLLGWGSAILGLATNLSKDKELLDAKDTVDTLHKAYNVLNTSSVSSSAGRSIISPMVLVEQSLIHQEYMNDLMNIVNMRDIRDVLTHIDYQSTIGGVRIGELVDSINPNRNAGFLCMEGCEAFSSPKVVEDVKKILDNKVSKEPETGHGTADNYQLMQEFSPLAVGKTVNASISYNGKQTNFPLTFRQVPIPANKSQMELVFQSVKKGDGWFVRIKDYKAGGITGPELLTGIDTIRNEFKIRTRDMTGYYGEANQRENNNRLMSLKTGRISVNTLANTIILDKSTADSIEVEIGIRFGSSKMDQIRKHVKANTIIIVNDNAGTFTFYSMGSSIKETYTRADIRTKTKKADDTGTLENLIKLLNGR